MRLAKLVPLLVFGALLYAPAGSATSLTPNATFYVPMPIPILLTSDWADTAAVAVSPEGNLVYVTDAKGSEVLGALLRHWQLTVQFAGQTPYAPSSASRSLTVSALFLPLGLFDPS